MSYLNYLVLPRTFLQSMPEGWQHRFTAMLDELKSAFRHVPQPEAYRVDAAEEHVVHAMTVDQLERAGITAQDGPCGEDHEHDPGDGASCWAAVTYTETATGREVDPHEHVLIPVDDPVPPYDRGRTRIEPRLPAGGRRDKPIPGWT